MKLLSFPASSFSVSTAHYSTTTGQSWKLAALLDLYPYNYPQRELGICVMAYTMELQNQPTDQFIHIRVKYVRYHVDCNALAEPLVSYPMKHV